MTKSFSEQMALFDQSGDRKYFTIVPNIVWEKDLSACDFRLYVTIKKVAGPNGTCYMSTKRLAQEAGISMGSVSESKQNLRDAGLITITRRKHSASGQAIDHITIVDIWAENILHFTKPSPEPDKPSPGELKPSPGELKPSPAETEEELSNKNLEEEKEEKAETISFNDFEGHPNSIKNKPEGPSSKGPRPSVADPSKDPPEVEELARQLATPIDLVWDYDKATNKSLLHAARELFRQCKQGSIDDILDALDAYLDPAKSNAQWVRENIDSPMGLVTLVARQYQKRQAQAQRRITSRTEWQDASDRTQEALAERELAPERDPWWDQVLADLSLQMPKAMFDTYIKDTTLLARDGNSITVGVKSQHVLEWIENRLASIIDRSLTGYQVERVQFEVVGISSSDVGPLMGKEE